jgi:transposase
MPYATALPGPQRRRRWSDEDRRLIVEAAFSPGAVVTEVARRHDVSTALVYN